jgi:hypothetical protein
VCGQESIEKVRRDCKKKKRREEGMSRERKRKESMRAGGWECDEGEKTVKGR